MRKILFISNIAGKKGVDSFSIASVNAAKEKGLEFHIAANYSKLSEKQKSIDEKEYDITIHQIDFIRNPLHPGNVKAYHQLVDLIKKEKFDIIHCNTPIGGVCGRLAGRKCKVKKIIYQAHGFHFYKGAPLKNWLLYYPAERFLAHYTDAIITINQEDYVRAKKFRLKNHGKVYHVSGVGIDTSQYLTDKKCRIEKRLELGLQENEIALISMGDLVDRKNYPVAIEAIAKTGNIKIHYYICGQGPEEEKLKQLVSKLGIEKQVHFLGYRADVKELLNASDIFLFTTLQEGLSRSLMEAMASGLPCIASDIRGNVDLLEDGKGGFLVPVDDGNVVANRISILAGDADLRKKMSLANLTRILDFSTGKVKKEIENLYEIEIGRGGKLIEFIPFRYKKRAELGINFDQFVIISVGELNVNKNNRVVIKAIAKIQRKDICYLLCGAGDEQKHLMNLSEQLGIQNQIHFLGYRSDVSELYQVADAFMLLSFREGLSRSLMEAMASGLPCIVSDIRGNRDLIIDGEGGFLVPTDDTGFIATQINKLIDNEILCKKMTKSNLNRMLAFDTAKVKNEMESFYKTEFSKGTAECQEL